MSETEAADARSVLLFHFLFEALRLHLLPPNLSRVLTDLAAAAEDNNEAEVRASAVGKVFLEEREALDLPDLSSFDDTGRSLGHVSKLAFSQVVGVTTHRAAVERLGRFCEQLINRANDRRASGSYYTPAWIADEIATSTVNSVLRGRTRALRVMDPAAGAGAFAVAAIEAIARAAGEGEEDNEIRRAVARDGLFAIEMNPLAAEVCRLAVWLAASRPDRPAAVPSSHIVIGDALDALPALSPFDIVLGNPPWGVKLPPDRVNAMTRLAPHLAGHRDSFLFFLHLAQRATCDDGAIGMLLPEAFLWQVRYQAMRRALLDRFRPQRVVLFGDRIFPGATAPTCLLCLAGKELAPDNYDTSDLRRIRRSVLPREVGSAGWSAPREASLTAPHHSFLIPPEWLRDLLARLCSVHPTLGDMKEVFTFHDAGINYPRADLGQKMLYPGPRQHERDLPVVRGRDFSALGEIGSSAWLHHDWREHVRPEDGVSVRESIYSMTPKLLLRQTSDRPIATVDRRGVYFGRSVIAITARSERELLWLAGVLNSTTFAALYRALTPEAGRSFAQVKVNKLKLVLIPRVGEGDLVELTARILDESDASVRAGLFAELDELAARAYGLTAAEVTALTDTLRPGARAGTTKRIPPADT